LPSIRGRAGPAARAGFTKPKPLMCIRLIAGSGPIVPTLRQNNGNDRGCISTGRSVA
jgi:hypothetical protein